MLKYDQMRTSDGKQASKCMKQEDERRDLRVRGRSNVLN